jgi:VWFA-related protein
MLLWRRVAAAGVLAGAAMASASAAQQQQTPPTFRTRTTLRAIEVRVVDQRGRPITDLRQEDFRVEENGRPQEIRLFTPIDLTPQAPAPDDAGLVRAGTRPSDLSPSNRRVFLIVLGRGNLQIPSKGIDGMIHLVRHLLPQDLVAVQAWNRATDFTTSHEQIARMLERYRDGHQQVEALLAHHFSGLAAIYGNRDIPDWMAKEIDAVLHGPDAPATRTLVSGASTDAVEAGIRRNTDLLQGTPSLDPFRALEAEQLGVSLDEYVSNSVQSMQDLTRLYAGLAYLRYLEGDKHLVYVSPAGLRLPSTDDDRSLARVAQDARVVIDIFHSDGMSARMWDVASSKNIAEFTGGQFTGLTYGDKFAGRIDATTRTGYQLGYAPSDPALDGRYRKVTVKVNRRGARVLHQQGYYAREEFTTFSRRQIIAQTRVEAALRYPQPVNDLELAVEARRGKAADGRRQLSVQVNIRPEALAVTGTGPDRMVSLDVAVFCFDRQFLVGYVWRRVDVRLPDDRYARFLRSGVGFTVHVPIRRSANLVKAVVYDAHGDRLGTAMPKIQ